jgi:hypothetical protein
MMLYYPVLLVIFSPLTIWNQRRTRNILRRSPTSKVKYFINSLFLGKERRSQNQRSVQNTQKKGDDLDQKLEVPCLSYLEKEAVVSLHPIREKTVEEVEIQVLNVMIVEIDLQNSISEDKCKPDAKYCSLHHGVSASTLWCALQ